MRTLTSAEVFVSPQVDN